MTILARNVHWFQAAVGSKLPTRPDRATVMHVAQNVARAGVFKPMANSLVKLTMSGFDAHGPEGLHEHLKTQAIIAEDLAAMSSPNFKLEGPLTKKTLGPLLQTTLRKGARNLDVSDTMHAFALENGVPLMVENIKTRYAPPKLELGQWQKSVIQNFLDAGLTDTQATTLAQALAADVESWRASVGPLGPDDHHTLKQRFQTLTELLKPESQTLKYGVKSALWRLSRTPAEVTIAASAALSVAVLAQLGVQLTHEPTLLAGVFRLLQDSAGALTGWLAADVVSALSHCVVDNVRGGRLNREFQGHHQHPKNVLTYPLTRNADNTSLGSLPLLAGLLMLETGPLVAGAVVFINGLVYAQQLHAYAHQTDPDKVPLFIKALRSLHLAQRPEDHIRGHHGAPVGSQNFGIVNGMMNRVLEKSGFMPWFGRKIEGYTGQRLVWKDEEDKRQTRLAEKERQRLEAVQKKASENNIVAWV